MIGDSHERLQRFGNQGSHRREVGIYLMVFVYLPHN